LQLNDTATLLLFQPAAFAAGDAEPLIVGAVLSSCTVAEVDAEFPATSFAVPDTI